MDIDVLMFQDSFGTPYLAQKDYIINCNQGCKLKAYTYDFDLSSLTTESASFSFESGHRVDVDTHNFIIFRNFINLSFSYMTFVIKDNFDKSGYIMDDFLFDIEGYDFLINKQNLFFNHDLITEQYDKLSFILKNYELVDPVLLETLHYQNDITEEVDKKIPLHLALEAKNTRIVNLILKYMSKVDQAALDLIKDIFEELIIFKNFAHYLNHATF